MWDDSACYVVPPLRTCETQRHLLTDTAADFGLILNA